MGSTDLAQGEDWVNGGHLVFQWVIAVTTPPTGVSCVGVAWVEKLFRSSLSFSQLTQ